VSSSDTAPVLWSLGATVRLVSASGERTIPLSALYRDDGIEYLAKRRDEILAEIVLPPGEGWTSIYLKLRRRGSFDFPVLGVAVAARVEDDTVRDARIVLGAVASLPREAKTAAAALIGERLTPELIARVADLAAGPSKPLDNTDYAHFYRKRMTRVFVSRALRRIAGLEADGRAEEALA
jgi:4-hydroxybenzoyl-CoA reductase subunit beta